MINKLFIKDVNRVLSGRAEGAKERKCLELDKRDLDSNRYIVYIPDDKMAICISWFLSCFGSSIRLLGEYKFREKYAFMCKNNLIECIEDGIDKAQNLELP